MYAELWKVTARKDGCIYKAANTNKHVRAHAKLPEGYIKVAFSTKLCKQDTIAVHLIEVEEITSQ